MFLPDQRPIIDQVAAVRDKWDDANPNCVFKHYFYNKVDEANVPFYRPGPSEDAREWEEALQKKPAPGFMPVLCSGYSGLADRLKTERRAVSDFTTRVHQINGSLDAILQRHELETEVRALNARRRQTTITQRCLALAARVQILRNRGYTLSGDEDDLQGRLQALEREVQDPAVGAREEELWSKLIVLRGYAEQLNTELEKPAGRENDQLDPATEAHAKRVSDTSHRKAASLTNALPHSLWRASRPSCNISKRRWMRSIRTTRAGRKVESSKGVDCATHAGIPRVSLLRAKRKGG